MTFEFRDAVRQDVPLLILLAGASGSGKTESALRLATGIAEHRPFAVIDTENGRALHKADDYTFSHTDFQPPYTPERYAEAIRDAAAFPVIVIDSGSHEYDGEGGVLDSQLAELKRLGGGDNVKLLSWADPKRRHKLYVRELLRTPSHVIVCHRAEDKIEFVKDSQGKTKAVEKASLIGTEGYIPICEKRLPFEATISLVLTPDNPGVPLPVKLERRHADLIPLDQQLSEETGARLAAWAAGKTSPAQGPAGTSATHAGTGGASNEWADESAITAVLELAAKVGDTEHAIAVDAIAGHRARYGNVNSVWLRQVDDALRGKIRPPLPAGDDEPGNGTADGSPQAVPAGALGSDAA